MKPGVTSIFSKLRNGARVLNQTRLRFLLFLTLINLGVTGYTVKLLSAPKPIPNRSVEFLETLLEEEFSKVDTLTNKYDQCWDDYRHWRARAEKCLRNCTPSVED